MNSCAPKPKQAKTTLKLTPSLAIANINMDGGAIVYGQQQDGGESWGRIFRPGEDVVVDMNFGVWNFSVFAFSGSAALGGTRECAILNNINIEKESEVIDMVVNTANCGPAGVRRLNIKRCTSAEFTSADPSANCSQTSGIESYRLRFVEHRFGAPQGAYLISGCYRDSLGNFNGTGRAFIPAGVTNVQTMPFDLIVYTGGNCEPGTDTTGSVVRMILTDTVGNQSIYTTAPFNIDSTASNLAAIANETVGENVAITTKDANNTSGGDTDGSGSVLTYSCLYDTTIDASVIGAACTGLIGVSFNTATGVMDWTPSFIQAGTYEFQITATEALFNRTSSRIFSITVTNVDRAPVLAAIADETVEEGTAITTVNADDTSGGDTDIDGDTLTYTCVFDQVVDGAVSAGTACTSLAGTATFNTVTGVFDWTPSLLTLGAYEIKITAVGGPDTLTDDELFVITVTDTTPIIDGTLNGTNWAVGPGPTHEKSQAVGTWTPSGTADVTNQRLNLYHASGCTGTAIQTHMISPTATDFTFKLPFGHAVYSYKLSGIDDASNESAGVCSSDLTVNQGFMDFGGWYKDGVISGICLYAMKQRSVDIFDINTSPIEPTRIGSLQYQASVLSLNQNDNLFRVLIIGSHAYLIGGHSIAVFNVTAPTAPVFVGRWDHNMINTVKDAVVAGNYLFMMDTNGLIAWDVSTPSAPVLLNSGSEYPLNNTGNMAVEYSATGTRLFTLNEAHISSYDLASFPGVGPTFEGTTATGMTNASDLGIDDTNNVIYVVGDATAANLASWDIGGAPSLTALRGPETFQQIRRVGTFDETARRLYGCGNAANGGVFDVAATPAVVGSLNSTVNVLCQTVVGNATHFYMLSRNGVFAGAIAGGNDILSTTPVGEAANYEDISFSGTNGVVATNSDRVLYLDMTDPHSPKQVGIIDNAGTLVDDVEIVGTTVFTLSGSLFAAHDASLLPSATQQFSVTLSAPSGSGMVLDDYTTPTKAFVAGNGNDLSVVDIGGQVEQRFLNGTVCVGGTPTGIAYKAPYIYVSCGTANKVEIYDATNTAVSLPLTHTVSALADSALSITLGANHAYVALGASGFAILDISTPASASISAT